MKRQREEQRQTAEKEEQKGAAVKEAEKQKR